MPVTRRDNSNRRKWRPNEALQLTWACSRALWTSIAPITVFGFSSVVGISLPTQLNLDVIKIKHDSIQNEIKGKTGDYY